MKNLALLTFSLLRDMFFDEEGTPISFPLREKRNTQDDPFDEYLAASLDSKLSSFGVGCQKSSGPLISPDMAVYRKGVKLYSEVENNPDNLIGIEVKKLERGSNGKIARATGLDFNSTPPCGKIRIYASDDTPLTVKSFYLFACLESNNDGNYYVSAMSLCDGSILNDDFDLYTQITGSREKGIGLGTYGDGANRNRPMLIFSNPLGADLLDHKISMINGLDLTDEVSNIKVAWTFSRQDVNKVDHLFFAYVDERDIPADHKALLVKDPFPTPKKRVSETQGRGKFKLQI